MSSIGRRVTSHQKSVPRGSLHMLPANLLSIRMPKCQGFHFLNWEMLVATTSHWPHRHLCWGTLCPNSFSGLGRSDLARSEVDPSSQRTQPGAFVYVLALATNRVLSEASWESCIPFILAERNPGWQIPPSFNYRNSQQTHGRRLNQVEKRASSIIVSSGIWLRTSHLGFSNPGCSWLDFPLEKWFISADKLKPEAPNQVKKELHLEKNSSVAESLIKTLKLGRYIYIFHLGLNLQKRRKHNGNYQNKSDQMKHTPFTKTNQLFNHSPQLLEREV